MLRNTLRWSLYSCLAFVFLCLPEILAVYGRVYEEHVNFDKALPADMNGPEVESISSQISLNQYNTNIFQ